ncbi:MAG TPA: lamin tail domain-containing protein, partial [Anaerolineales bacterium]|nr:lamin tail domain-containing protein [Anaerolineales bacterium]
PVMIENIKKQINSFLSALKTSYSQQGPTGKFLIPALFLLVICCLCSITISLLRPRNSPTTGPSPIGIASQGSVATPTALFNFGPVTFTPFPTFPPPTAFPTFTPPPTATETPTSIAPTGVPTETATLIPTSTNPPATATNSGYVLIIRVNKTREFVDIQNLSNGPVDLSGWRLVSETGDQSCTLSGVLQPSEILRIWARKGNSGFSCRFSSNIWIDNRLDPAVLYDPQGNEVSRYP